MDWTTGQSRFDLRQRKEIFPLTSVSRPALGPTQPPVQWVPGVLSPRVKRGRGVTLTKLRKSWMCRSYISSPHKHLHRCVVGLLKTLLLFTHFILGLLKAAFCTRFRYKNSVCILCLPIQSHAQPIALRMHVLNCKNIARLVGVTKFLFT
jgi:hypothetical protein